MFPAQTQTQTEALFLSSNSNTSCLDKEFENDDGHVTSRFLQNKGQELLFWNVNIKGLYLFISL